MTALLRGSESHAHSRRILSRSGTTCATALHTQVDRFNEIVLGKDTAPSRAGSPSMMAADDTRDPEEESESKKLLQKVHLASRLLS